MWVTSVERPREVSGRRNTAGGEFVLLLAQPAGRPISSSSNTTEPTQCSCRSLRGQVPQVGQHMADADGAHVGRLQGWGSSRHACRVEAGATCGKLRLMRSLPAFPAGCRCHLGRARLQHSRCKAQRGRSMRQACWGRKFWAWADVGGLSVGPAGPRQCAGQQQCVCCHPFMDCIPSTCLHALKCARLPALPASNSSCRCGR